MSYSNSLHSSRASSRYKPRQVTAFNPIVAQRHINTDIPIDVPVSNNSNNKAQSNGFKFYLSASMVALLLTNLHISYMLSVLN